MKSKWLGNRESCSWIYEDFEISVKRFCHQWSDVSFCLQTTTFPTRKSQVLKEPIIHTDRVMVQIFCIFWPGCFKLYIKETDEELTPNLNWCRISSHSITRHVMSLGFWGCYLVTSLKNASNKWIFQSKNTTSEVVCGRAKIPVLWHLLDEPKKNRRKHDLILTNRIIHVGLSKNRGTPKWMIYNGKPY